MSVLSRIVTIGSLYSQKLFAIPTVRARKYGSVGGSNGSFAMMICFACPQRSYSSRQVSMIPIRIVRSIFLLNIESIFPLPPESHWMSISVFFPWIFLNSCPISLACFWLVVSITVPGCIMPAWYSVWVIWGVWSLEFGACNWAVSISYSRTRKSRVSGNEILTPYASELSRIGRIRFATLLGMRVIFVFSSLIFNMMPMLDSWILW